MKQIIPVFILIASFNLGCQDSEQVSPKNIDKIQYYSFPKDWIGEYFGDLNIHGLDSVIQTLPMRLKIKDRLTNGEYPWIIQYGQDDIREYAIKAADESTGHFIMDERNSILLDGFNRGNHFLSRFEVMGSDLLVDYELTELGINMKIIVSRNEAINSSGDQIVNGDTIPPVQSYPIVAVQEAVLLKKDNQ